MTDATVPRTRREDSLVRGEEIQVPRAPVVAVTPAIAPEAPAGASVAPAMSRVLVLLWVASVAGLTVFLAFGSVRIGAGNWIGRRMPVREIWARFVRYLVEEGASTAIVLGVSLAAALTLIGAAYVLWRAFALKDAPIAQPPDDAAER